MYICMRAGLEPAFITAAAASQHCGTGEKRGWKCGIDNDRDGHPFPSHLEKMAVVLCLLLGSFMETILQLIT